MNQIPNSRFKFFPQLNNVERESWLNSTNTFFSGITNKHFNSDSLQDTFLRKIARARMLSIKEVFESFEFFARIRKTAKSPVVADLCCGHGLVGILFAMFERKVANVFLIDKSENENRLKLMELATECAPWIAHKLDMRVAKIDSEGPWNKPDSGVAIVSAHACGQLSDICIRIAVQNKGPLAILPCCYPRTECEAPLAIQTQFGLETAFDIHRTYILEQANYQVRWAEIPPQITPMNRVIYGQQKKY